MKCPPDNVKCWVNQFYNNETLIATNNCNFIIKKIAEFGDTAFPLIINKLNLKNNLKTKKTILALSELKNEKAILPLLNLYHNNIDNELKHRTLNSIWSILEKRTDVSQPTNQEVTNFKKFVYNNIFNQIINGDSTTDKYSSVKDKDKSMKVKELLRKRLNGIIIIRDPKLDNDFTLNFLPDYKLINLNDNELKNRANSVGDFYCYRINTFYFNNFNISADPSNSILMSNRNNIQAIAVVEIDFYYYGSKLSHDEPFAPGSYVYIWEKALNTWSLLEFLHFSS